MHEKVQHTSTMSQYTRLHLLPSATKNINNSNNNPRQFLMHHTLKWSDA